MRRGLSQRLTPDVSAAGTLLHFTKDTSKHGSIPLPIRSPQKKPRALHFSRPDAPLLGFQLGVRICTHPATLVALASSLIIQVAGTWHRGCSPTSRYGFVTCLSALPRSAITTFPSAAVVTWCGGCGAVRCRRYQSNQVDVAGACRIERTATRASMPTRPALGSANTLLTR